MPTAFADARDADLYAELERFCGGKGSRRPGPCPKGRAAAHLTNRAHANAAEAVAARRKADLKRAEATHGKQKEGTAAHARSAARLAAAKAAHETAAAKALRLAKKARELEHQHGVRQRLKAAAAAKRAAKTGGRDGGRPGDARGSGRTAGAPAEGGGPVAGAPEGSGGGKDGGGRPDGDKPAGKGTAGRVPANVSEVNRRIGRFEGLFRSRGEHQAADWMAQLRDHVNAVGTDEALKALGGEVKGAGDGKGDGTGVLYGGGWDSMGHFAEAYLARNGITPLHAAGPDDGDKKQVSSLAPSPEGVPSRGRAGDVAPVNPTLKDKLEEAQGAAGPGESEDLEQAHGRSARGAVTHLTPDVAAKLDEKYGKGQWIVKTYGDDAFAGQGIYFPQRAAQAVTRTPATRCGPPAASWQVRLLPPARREGARSSASSTPAATSTASAPRSTTRRSRATPATGPTRPRGGAAREGHGAAQRRQASWCSRPSPSSASTSRSAPPARPSKPGRRAASTSSSGTARRR
jgi:hypothetical protein